MMRPRICVSVPVYNTERALNMIGCINGDADMVELRLDYSGIDTDVRRLRDATELPIVATNRSAKEGGRWRAAEEDRIKLLTSALEAGVEYVDVELSADVARLAREARENGAEVIASRHYGSSVPEIGEMESLLRETKIVGASLLKVIGTARSYAEGLACLEFLRAHSGNVCFAMGVHGVPSRVLSPLVGGAFTYASAQEGEEAAPGQLTAQRLREIYALMGVGE
jgi:3-dehydroquinate dehydratase type I